MLHAIPMDLRKRINNVWLRYLWFVMLLLLHIAAARQRQAVASHKSARTYVDVKDKIIELQCFARCSFSAKSADCLKQCHSTIVRQPRLGYCPKSNAENVTTPEQEISPLQRLSCLYTCQYDFDCPEVQKCCDTNACGPVCTNALGVEENQLLPPIPKILKFKLRQGHKVVISVVASSVIASANSTYLWHVEARSHVGVLYSPRKLSNWQWQPVEKLGEISELHNNIYSYTTEIRFNLKPSRWYQVRVAAINANGFRGYSEPSAPFSLLNHPKPPKAPVDLTVVSKHFDSDTNSYSVRIIWCPSKSNLPIEKYKVIWSLYVQKSKDQSYISNEAYVKDTHQFRITKLLPDSVYYIQVQAIGYIGKRRLKSDTCSRVYNVSASEMLAPFRPLNCLPQQQQWARRHYEEDDDMPDMPTASTAAPEFATNAANTTISPNNKPNGYDVRYRLNRKFGMIVQISGFLPYKEKVYELCPKETNCEQREYSAIRAKKNSLEFSKLKYNTAYVLKPHNAIADGSSSKPFVFQTPECENFRKRYPKMQIQC